MTTIEIFKKMLDWLCVNIEDVKNQTDVARIADLNETTVSRIMKNRVKSVKQETLWKVNTAFGNVFNPEWLRGESDVMLLADLTSYTTTSGTPMDVPAQVHTDLTAQLIAAKDEIIATLRNQLKDKDALIESKNRHIDILQQQIIDLRNLKKSLGDTPLHRA